MSTGTPHLTPEAVVDALRALRAQIAEVTPLTAAERRPLRLNIRRGQVALQAGINVIGASDIIARGVGKTADEMQDLQEETHRWSVVEDELRALLAGVAGANLVRRHRLRDIAARAYNVSKELAKDAEYAFLIPHVEEMMRLKRLQRRKKTRG